MEIERKWKFNMEKVPTAESSTITKYRQAYLSIKPEVRIRGKQTLGNPESPECMGICCTSETYMLCMKGEGDIARDELQKELTEEEFKMAMRIGNLADEDFAHKEYYRIDIDGHTLVVGTVDKGTTTEFCYGEIEFASIEEANAFTPPEWFGEEITYDDNYKMKNYWDRNYGKVKGSSNK